MSLWLLAAAFLAGVGAGAAGLARWRRHAWRSTAIARVAGPPPAGVGRTTSGFESLESVAFGVCEAAREITGAPTAVVLREPMGPEIVVVAVSQGGDRRLLRTPVTPDSVAARACTSDIPIVGVTCKELFGHFRTDRRRRGEQGTAYPLQDGRQGVGALVVFDRISELAPAARERLRKLLVDGGPRLAAAAAIRAAELRAITDELTGIWNRRALDQVMQGPDDEPCALLLVDLDHFKNVNDTHGHAAGDAALRHVARVLRSTLREQDLAARVGGEEFAVWLPNTSVREARDVAERVRAAIAGTPFEWSGRELQLTCSVGVAARPDIVSQVANLYPAADAALYRAKEAGRNRVETALPSR